MQLPVWSRYITAPTIASRLSAVSVKVQRAYRNYPYDHHDIQSDEYFDTECSEKVLIMADIAGKEGLLALEDERTVLAICRAAENAAPAYDCKAIYRNRKSDKA